MASPRQSSATETANPQTPIAPQDASTKPPVFADLRYRYEKVSELVPDLGRSILDVGGFSTGIYEAVKTGWPMISFSMNSTSAPPSNVPTVVADARTSVFKRRSFDTVLLLDVLEHAPRADRTRILFNSLGYAKKRLLICFPFSSEENVAAEERFRRTMTRVGHPGKRSIEEHREYGLPLPNDYVTFFERHSAKATRCFATSRTVLFSALHAQAQSRSIEERDVIVETMDRKLLKADHDLAPHDAYRVFIVVER